MRWRLEQGAYACHGHITDATPSVRKEELAAVTVPCGLTKAGFSVA